MQFESAIGRWEGRRRRGSLLMSAAVLAAGAALGGLALVQASTSRAVSPEPVPSVARPVAAPAPLPREWRWEPKAVEFEHMFRQRR